MGKSKHNHVVPAGYLSAWAPQGLIAMRLLGDTRSVNISVRDAAVRTGFYLEQMPDGSTSDWFEERLAKVESRLLPVIQRVVGGSWQLTTEDRGRVAEFLGLQLVRTPGWRAFHTDAVAVERHELPARFAGLSDDEITSTEDELRTDRKRHNKMAEHATLVGTMIANMHWTLLVCDDASLATSDHPVVAIEIAGGVEGASRIPVTGMLNTSEVRFAVSPRRLLVATWRDQVDGEPPQWASAQQIQSHNAALVGRAEKQWFHVPGEEVPLGGDDTSPIADSLFGRYDPTNARRRYHVVKIIEHVLSEPPGERKITVAEWGHS